MLDHTTHQLEASGQLYTLTAFILEWNFSANCIVLLDIFDALFVTEKA